MAKRLFNIMTNYRKNENTVPKDQILACSVPGDTKHNIVIGKWLFIFPIINIMLSKYLDEDFRNRMIEFIIPVLFLNYNKLS